MLRRSPNASLKEKLKEHYQNRNFTASATSASKGGMIATACGIFSLFLECIIILLPAVYFGQNEEGSTMTRYGWLGEQGWVMLLLVMFNWVEVTWNWWRVYYDIPNWVTKEMKTARFGQILDTPEGWRHCPTCQLDAPPRSHHCQHCGHCILKRDTHCFFTGSCIGFYNHRHFIIFLLHTIWGCVLGIYLQVAYIHLALPLPDNYNLYIPPVPLFHLFMGDLTFGIFLVILHVYINVFFICTAATFFIWHLVIILRGQTTYEAWKVIRTYDFGLYSNFTSVFGSPLNWGVLFFAPLLLPLEGDGIKWHIKHKSGKGH